MIELASESLLWERFEERSNQPVLDLSRRHQDDGAIDNGKGSSANTAMESEDEEWHSGCVWETTKEGLGARNISIVDDEFLKKCPQLLRLDSSIVLDSADWILEQFADTNASYYIEQEPRLLSYKLVDLEYGLEFLSTMMMMSSADAVLKSPLCTPTLFLTVGVDGGLQERATKEALGAASGATYSANKQVAADGMTAYKALKEKRKGL